jgi:hypothetical protein
MPAGDASRTWFPEMLQTLGTKWRPDMSFVELIALRDELDKMLHRIRSERHIHALVVTCWRCGHVGPDVEPDVSVRAMILSLGRFGIAPADQVKGLEEGWAAYREQNGLDLHGKVGDPAAAALLDAGTKA